MKQFLKRPLPCVLVVCGMITAIASGEPIVFFAAAFLAFLMD
jgi:hypothetical protein